jgi:integrase
MSKNNKKSRKTRSDKFPLTLHKTGQYCKKIKGKIYYFGNDRKVALQRYYDQAAFLHTGRPTDPKPRNDSFSMKMLCNLYLDHQESRAAIKEIKQNHVYGQTLILRSLVRFVGPNCQVLDVSTMDLQNYRKKLIKSNKSSNTINNHIATIKALYNWALDNEIVKDAPNLRAIKKVTISKTDKPIFDMSQIEKLLQSASEKMKAMIWLGLNCGFGCTDCAQLKWENVDLKTSRVVFPRGKTGVNRNLPLWPETVKALREIQKSGDLVFYTSRGNTWVRMIEGTDKHGNKKHVKDDAVTKEFTKLLKKTNLKTEKGMGFYTLRRTAATLAARSGDPFAVQKLLGHADLKMATTYVQDVSEQTDRVINNTRKLIIQDGS